MASRSVRPRLEDGAHLSLRVLLHDIAGTQLWTGAFAVTAFVYEVYCVAYQLKPGCVCDLVRDQGVVKRIGKLVDLVAEERSLSFTVIWHLSMDVSVSFPWRSRKQFVALCASGRICCWGRRELRTDYEFIDHQVQSRHVEPPTMLSGVKQLCGNDGAYAVITPDCRLVTWGSEAHGGDSSRVSSSLGEGVVSVACTRHAFAVVRLDGGVVAWGDASAGGLISSETQKLLERGVVRVYGSDVAFAAVKEDNSVVTWGDTRHGGAFAAVFPSMQQRLRQLIVISGGFAVLTDDGRVSV